MPKYFVCQPGPMGGCHIIFVAEDRAAAVRFIDGRPKETLYLYELQREWK